MAFLVPVFTAIGSTLGAGGAAAGTAAAAGTGFSLSSAFTVGSAFLGALGSLSQGQAAANAADYNAQVQEQQADMEQQQAGARATEVATRTRQRVAATRAGAVQNGFETDGSVSDILNLVETQGALEGLTSLYDGDVRARGLRNSAELSRANARNSLSAGYLNAGTSILTGFSRAYTG